MISNTDDFYNFCHFNMTEINMKLISPKLEALKKGGTNAAREYECRHLKENQGRLGYGM